MGRVYPLTIRKEKGLLLVYLSRAGIAIALISHKNFGNLIWGVLINILHPVSYVVKGSLISNIINKKNTHGTSVICCSNRPKPLLVHGTERQIYRNMSMAKPHKARPDVLAVAHTHIYILPGLPYPIFVVCTLSPPTQSFESWNQFLLLWWMTVWTGRRWIEGADNFFPRLVRKPKHV